MLVQTYYAYTVHVRTHIHVQTNYLYTSTCTCTCTAHIYTHMHTRVHIHTHTQIFCAECAGYVANLKYLDNKPGRVCHTCCIKLKGGEDYSKGSVARDPCPVTSLPTPSHLLPPSPSSCLHLSLSSSHLRIDASSQESSTVSPHKRKKKLSEKQMTMPAVLTEMKARDRSAQISGYLFTHKSKTKKWKKRWYVVYNLVLYEFVRHEVGIADM